MIISISGKIGSGKDLVGNIIQYYVESAQNLSIHYTFNDFTDRPKLGENLSGWKIVKFADKLKDIVCLLIGCTREQLEDRDFKEKELGEEWWYCKYTILDSNKKKGKPFVNPMTGSDIYSIGTKKFYDYLLKKGETEIYNATLCKHTPRTLLQTLGTQYSRQIVHPNIWVNATMSDYVVSQFVDGTIKEPNWIITDCRFPNEANAVKERGGINIRVNRPSTVEVSTHESETALDSYDFDYVIENTGTIEDLVVKVEEILLKEGLL